ncbi:flagellinolysin [Butyrivibrio sp. LC3010]|uniref:flagellinolysin n=1 Tax=Butyrivibrio sp. LC3010 TaxID=1280680 RepID=UPI000409CE9E|nr:flagellinolysin [Butyrivibrio sp. LC3010]
MVIQHNLQALNSNIQVGISTSGRARSAEKLASGYQINRAADDAAGLSISEKMRRQMRGLGRAVNNGRDGISFVQIADGALTELHEMLQRGNELAVQAANGTNTPEDRRAINNEIVQLKNEIDAITSKTKFNELNVFLKEGPEPPKVQDVPTSPDIPDEIKNPLVDVAEKISEEYYPNAIEQIINGIGSVGSKLRELASTEGTSQFDTALIVNYLDGPGNTLAQMGASFVMPGQGFESNSLSMKVDSDDYPSINVSEQELGKLESTIAHETMHAVMDVVFPRRMATEGGAEDFPEWFIEGAAQLAGGGFAAGWNSPLQSIASQLSSESDNRGDSVITEYLSQGGEFTVDKSPYGHGYLAAAYASYLAADGNDVTMNNLRNGSSNLFQKFLDGDRGGRNDSFTDVIKTATGLTEQQLKDAINSGSNVSPGNGKYSPVEFIRRLAYNSLGGVGSFVADKLNTGGTQVLGSTAIKDEQPFKITSQSIKYVEISEEIPEELAKEIEEKGQEYTVDLHLGADADLVNKVNIMRYDMSTKALLLEDTNVLTSERATSAIDDFGNAILTVSAVRSYFGAIQNRLEHTMLNLGSTVENTTGAESRIRDTDMASEMVKQSMYNILSQAGQAMLAQANQTPQGVMALLQN